MQHNDYIALQNQRYHASTTQEALNSSLLDPRLGRIALVSSFGTQSVVLLHMISKINPDLPVIFVDTEMLFPATLSYQKDLAESLKLTNIQTIKPSRASTFEHDNDGLLHQSAPNQCCHLRKVAPLRNALNGYDTWISGRKRFQGGSRVDLDLFENDTTNNKIKINPLAQWSAEQVQRYIKQHKLPAHPLQAKGYHSVGCAPCTVPTPLVSDLRSGRWSDESKTECGIHL